MYTNAIPLCSSLTLLGISSHSSHLHCDDCPEDLERIEALAAMIGSGSLRHLESLTLGCSDNYKVLFISSMLLVL